MSKLGIIALGISAGLQYGLLATGLVLIYRAGRFVNFAQAQKGVFAAIVLAKLELDHGWPYPLALFAGLAVAALTAIVVERTVVQKLFSAPRLVLMVITIAVTQNLYGLTLFKGFHLGRHQIVPASPLVLNTTRVSTKGGFPVPFHRSVTVGGVLLDSAQLLTLVVAPAIAFGLYIYFARTRTGRAIRAASSNPDAARLAGISVRRVSLQVWIVAGVLSGLAAVLAQPSQPAFSQAAPGPGLLLRGLAAAMLAGFFDFRLAFLGGIAVGVVEQIARYNLHAPGISEVSVLAVLLLGVAWQGRRLAATVRRGDDVLVAAAPKPALTPRLRQLSLARNLDQWAWAVLFLVLVILPRLPGLTSGSRSAALVQIISFAIVGLSLTLLTGWAGQVSLGQFALVGVGAFVAAHLVEGGNVGLPLVILGAGAAASVCAIIVGLPALRYRGLFLAVTTLGLAVVAPAWLFHQRFLGVPRGGAAQMPLDRLLLPFGGHLTSYRQVYYLALGVLALVSIALARVRRSELGRALVAVRDNDSAASAAGLSPATTKLVALALSGFIAGVAGCLWAMANSTFSFVSFDATQSLIMLSVAIVGGLGTLCGPILGAFAVFAFPYLVPNQNSAVVRAIFSGGLLVVFMTYASGGLASLLHRARQRFLLYLEATLPARPFGPDPDAAPLVVAGLTVSFGGIRALDGIDLHVAAGEIVGLIGGNGAGKTTLMNCVSGHVNPVAGQISLFGQDVSGLSPRFRRALGAARSFQDAALYPGLTVLEAVKVAVDFDDHVSGVGTFFGAPWLGFAERRKTAAAVQALQLVGLEDHQHVLISQLSTGMRRLAELASVVAAQPKLVLLDEPTAGIAQREVEQFASVLRRIKLELNCAVLLIEHDMPLVMSLADRVYCLESGQVIAAGTPAEIQADPHVISSYLGTDPTAVERSAATRADRGHKSATTKTTRRLPATKAAAIHRTGRSR